MYWVSTLCYGLPFCAKYVINVSSFFSCFVLWTVPPPRRLAIGYYGIYVLLTLLCFSWLIYPFCDYIISIIWIPLLWRSFSICDLWIPVCTETASIPWHLLWIGCIVAVELGVTDCDKGRWTLMSLSLCNSIYVMFQYFSLLLCIIHIWFSSLFEDITITIDGRHSIELFNPI